VHEKQIREGGLVRGVTSSANVLCARCHSHHIAVVETVRHGAAARVAAVMHPPQWGLRSPQEYRRVVEGMYDARRPPLSVAAQVLSLATRVLVFFLRHRSHSISFTRAQGIPRYKIGFGREKDGRVGRDWLFAP
jgi:hypothetical protein